MNIFPKRGVIGGALTAVALALILSFKTPDATGLATVNSNGNTTGGTTGNNTGTTAGQPQPSSSGAGTGSGTGTRSTYSGKLTGQAVQVVPA